MKIAQVVCTFPPYPGGMGNVAFYNSLELARLGHQVEVLTPSYSVVTRAADSRADGYEEKNKLEVQRLNSVLRYGNAAFLPQLFWRLKNFDLVHLHYPFLGGAEIIWFRRLIGRQRSKLVVTYHMDLVGKGILGLFFRCYNKFFLPRIIRSADKVIVTSFDYALSSNLASLIQENRSKFVELPPGVMTEIFSPREKDATLLSKHQLKVEDKIILFVGNLDRAHYFKGIDYLLKAFAVLQKRRGVEELKKEQGGKIRLLIVGAGDWLSGLKSLANNLGLSNKIIFTGYIDDEILPRYYNLADLVVLPSTDRSEAFGLVLLEALASGKPVIASNLPGLRSLVKEGENGFLAQPKNEGDLANRISYLLGDDELRKKMGENGRKQVEEKYSWEKIGKQLEELYRGLT